MRSLVPLVEIRDGESCNAVGYVAWLRGANEVALAVSRERAGRALGFWRRLIELMTLGVAVTGKPRVYELLAVLNAVAHSPNYPFAFLPTSLTYVRGEEASAEAVATLHRLNKLPLPIASVHDRPFAVVDAGSSDHEALAVAACVAGFLVSTTRRGYELALALAQSLPLLRPNCMDCLLTLIAYVYTLYGQRVPREGGELLRHLVAAPPTPGGQVDPLKAFEAMVGELRWKATCEIDGLRAAIVNVFRGGGHPQQVLKRLQRLSDAVRDAADKAGVESRHEVVFGRLVNLLNTIAKGTGLERSYDYVVTVATGQWSVAQQTLLQALLRENGKLVVFYTQETLYNRFMAELLTHAMDSDIQSRTRNVKTKYVPVSATDVYATRRIIGKTLGKIVRRGGGHSKDNVLVVAQGAATIALALWLEAHRNNIGEVVLA